MRDIKLPMSAEDVRSLKLGEMITVSGLLFTGRSRFHIRAIEDDLYPVVEEGHVHTDIPGVCLLPGQTAVVGHICRLVTGAET